MEKLELSLHLVYKTLNTLEDAFDALEEAKATQNGRLVLAAEDSIIQRFEYCYDSFWKVFKKYLELVYTLEDINSPKKVFRACVKLQLCSELEGEVLIDMADDRNETSHNYDIEKVRIILSDVPLYYNTMVTILKKLKKKQTNSL
jgi:nucleotidyltransferase substrate binding protein (TIGR01987 family)